jgi:hypothetical protein
MQGHASQSNSHFQKQHQPPTSFLQKPPIPYQQPETTLEEGELSEGEFEDIYEPKDLTDASQAAPQNQPTQLSINPDIRNDSVRDADESSIYDPHDHQDDSVVQTPTNSLHSAEQEYRPDDEWEPSYPERERSGSYSPYLSPREVHRKISVAKAVSRDNKGA